MKQSQQSTQHGDGPRPLDYRDTPQSFESAWHTAMQWSGSILTRRQRRVNVQMFMGTGMVQSWPDLLIWEAFFNSYRVNTFLEIGTGHGGLSLFFGLQCAQRGIEFHTFDNVKSFPDNTPLSVFLDMNARFHHVDIFKEGHAQITELMTHGRKPLAVFFDNGDKPREWRTFAPYTSPGDYLAVHDWGREFGENDLTEIKVNRILGKMSDERPAGYKSMWFVRV